MPTRRRDIILRLKAARFGHKALFKTLPFLRGILNSPTASALASSLSAEWQIALRDLDFEPCKIDLKGKTIWLNNRGLSPLSIMRSRYFRKNMALNFMCALRSSFQASSKVDLYAAHNPSLWPHIARTLAADNALMTIRMAHELMHESDDETCWRTLMGEDIGDMAHVYASNLVRGSDKAALQLTYDKWFSSVERINYADAQLLEAMDAHPPHLVPSAANNIDHALIANILTDPLSNLAYLENLQTLHDMPSAINRVHFARILEDISAIRVGNYCVRDESLARRLMLTE